MSLFFFLIFLIIFIQTVSYGIYEIKNQNNASGGIVLICISFIIFILSN